MRAALTDIDCTVSSGVAQRRCLMPERCWIHSSLESIASTTSAFGMIRDGRIVHDGRDLLARMVGQIASPVRWDLCLETMEDLGVTGILEMPPAGTLTGIAKRALKGVETFALKTPEQLDEARAFCDRHGEFAEIDSSPTWRMVVSPAKGTFHISAEAEALDVLAAGATIGEVASLRDRTTITAAHGGEIVEWLVHDGDLVSPGQPLIRLHPEGGY